MFYWFLGYVYIYFYYYYYILVNQTLEPENPLFFIDILKYP